MEKGLFNFARKCFHFFQIVNSSLKQIRDIPGRETKFRVRKVGTQIVSFVSTDPRIRCVRICYRGTENVCDDKTVENSYVEVDSLSAFTVYKFILSECGNAKTHFGEYDIQTKHDSKFKLSPIHSLAVSNEIFQFQALFPITKYSKKMASWWNGVHQQIQMEIYNII